jgi:hypothetical protein
MKPIFKRRKLLVVFVILAFATISFFAGGIIGFDKGFEASCFFEGVDSFYTVLILRAVREGKDDQAISALETKLNGQIFNCGLFAESRDSIFNFHRWIGSRQKFNKSVENIMREVVKYRKEYPFPFPDTEVQKIIDNTIEKYSGITKET